MYIKNIKQKYRQKILLNGVILKSLFLWIMQKLFRKEFQVQSNLLIFYNCYSSKNNKPFRLAKKGNMPNVYKKVDGVQNENSINELDE